MRLPAASAAQAVISDTTRPAPSRAALRRNGASVIPDIGARKTAFGKRSGPILIGPIFCRGLIAAGALMFGSGAAAFLPVERDPEHHQEQRNGDNRERPGDLVIGRAPVDQPR